MTMHLVLFVVGNEFFGCYDVRLMAMATQWDYDYYDGGDYYYIL
jgi:hypothetical protein